MMQTTLIKIYSDSDQDKTYLCGLEFCECPDHKFRVIPGHKERCKHQDFYLDICKLMELK